MPVTINKEDKEGRPKMIADRDLYLDESREKVIVVEEGQEVPTEAAFILAMKGGWIPKEHEEKVKALGGAQEAQPEVQPEAQAALQSESPQPQQVGVIPEAESAPAEKRNKK